MAQHVLQRLAIMELHVEPRQPDWAEVLERTERAYEVG